MFGWVLNTPLNIVKDFPWHSSPNAIQNKLACREMKLSNTTVGVFIEQTLQVLFVFNFRCSSCHRKRGGCQIDRQTAFPYQGGACFEKRSYNSKGIIELVFICVFYVSVFLSVYFQFFPNHTFFSSCDKNKLFS